MSGTSPKANQPAAFQIQEDGNVVYGSGAGTTFGSGASSSFQSGATLTADSGATVDFSGSPSFKPVSPTAIAVNVSATAMRAGAHYLCTAADLAFALPDTALGLRYRIQISAAALSSGIGARFVPKAADKIMGEGISAADNKYVAIAGASDREGDWMEVTGDGVDGWYITGCSGTLARE